jgi:hypothetical protein
MKDSLFLQPLNGSGPLQSSKRPGTVPETDSDADTARHQDAAAEFSKEYDTQKLPANDTTAEAGTVANDTPEENPESTGRAPLNPNTEAIESGIYRFPVGENPFEEALQIRAEQSSSESNLEAEIIQSEANAPLSTIKAEDAPNTAAGIPDIQELIVETTNASINFTEQTPSDALTQDALQTIKLSEAETSIAQDDVVMAQSNQRSLFGAVEDTLNPSPTRTNRQSADNEAVSNADLPTLGLEDIDIDGIEAEGAIDLVDIESQLAKRMDNLSQQSIFPNVTQNNVAQSLIGLGGELAAPTVLSGTSSVSAAPQINATVPSPIANAIVSTVADAILTAKETPKGVMVQLDPPEMGRVYIDFMFDADNRVNVVVKADNIDSYNILRERSQDFLQMLGENGFANIDLSFEQQGSNNGSSEDNEKSQSYGVSYAEAAEDTLEASYRTPIYRMNEEQLRLDLRL